MTVVETPRLRLLLMSEHFLEACLADDIPMAEAELGLIVLEEWFYRKGLMRFRLNQLRSDPAYRPFALRAIVLKSTNEMVGNIAFHAPPDSADLTAHGLKGLELGYTIFEKHRRRGYVQEASLGLMHWAMKTHGVETFVVSISPENEASMGLAKKLGYVKVTEQMDPEDGLEEVFVLQGQSLQNALGLLEYQDDEAS